MRVHLQDHRRGLPNQSVDAGHAAQQVSAFQGRQERVSEICTAQGYDKGTVKSRFYDIVGQQQMLSTRKSRYNAKIEIFYLFKFEVAHQTFQLK